MHTYYLYSCPFRASKVYTISKNNSTMPRMVTQYMALLRQCARSHTDINPWIKNITRVNTAQKIGRKFHNLSQIPFSILKLLSSFSLVSMQQQLTDVDQMERDERSSIVPRGRDSFGMRKKIEDSDSYMIIVLYLYEKKKTGRKPAELRCRLVFRLSKRPSLWTF